jgi:VWFA-related protein
MMTVHALRGFLAGALALSLASSARPARGASGQAASSFPSRVDLITIDAVVVDAKGNPVPGLTRDDFAIEEDGEVREVVAFEAVSMPGTQGGAMTAPSPARQDHVVTNVDSGPAGGATFLLVFDDIHIRSTNAITARTTLDRFLRESTADGDRVLILSTGTTASWSGTMPADRGDLLAFVTRLQGRLVESGAMTENEALRIAEYSDTRVLQRVIGRYLSTALCAAPPFPCDKVVQADATANQARWRTLRQASLGVMQQAVESLGGLRGRKSVALLTEGFIHDDAAEAYRALVGAAQRVNAAIYFVDVRGLEALTEATSASAAREVGLNRAGAASSANSPAVTDAVRTMFESSMERSMRFPTIGVETMAEETGGFVVRNTNDLAGGVARAARESRQYYLLGYAPTPGKAPGGFRKIKVRVAGEGRTVRARNGYYAPPAPESTTPASATAARSNPPIAPVFAAQDGVPMRLATYVLGTTGDAKARVVAVTEIETSGLSFQDRAGRRVATLDLRMEAVPREGGERPVHTSALEVDAPDAGASSAAAWKSLRREFELPPGIFHVRASVRDAAGGKAGVVTQRLEIADPSRFGVSTPVLSDSMAPDVSGGVPTPAPVAHRSFTARRPLVCAVEAWGAARDPASGAPRVALTFVLRDGASRVLAQPPPTEVAPAADGRLQQMISIPIEQLPAGEYEAALTVEDRVAGKSEERRVAFVVEGVAPAAASAPVAAVVAAPPPAPDIAPILARAGAYVVEYAKVFSNIVAQEEYRQEYWNGLLHDRRYSHADLVFVRLPGTLSWATFRDVYEVDGNKVRDRSARLEKLFVGSAADTAASRATAILAESSRFNLGPVTRTVNIPTLALLFLDPANQGRFRFERKGTRKREGIETVELEIVELVRPTLVRGGAQRDAPVKGRISIDPETGAVLRTDVVYDFGSDSRDAQRAKGAHIVTQYRRDPGLGILVPVEMRETYGLPRETAVGSGIADDVRDATVGITIEATAQYAGYRRFEVTTDETFRGSQN